MSKTKESKAQNLLIGENLIELSLSSGATQAYTESIGKATQGVDCKITVQTDTIPEGYKTLSVTACKQCVAYRNSDGTISYRILTHKFVGKTMEFGAVFTPKGELELYSFISGSDDVKCKFIAKKKLANNIVDPMFALISEDTIYVAYNVPSYAALMLTAQNRRPITEGMTSIASGAPNVVSFNLVTNEQEKAFPKLKSMSLYALHVITSKGEPALLVANIFDVDAPSERVPTFSGMISSLLSGDDEELPAHKQFPVGVSIARFVKKAEIVQIPPAGDPSRGVSSVILNESNDAGENVIDIITEDDDGQCDECEQQTETDNQGALPQ